MSKHKHEWRVEGEQLGYVNIKCKGCDLKIELYPKHLEVWRYGDECAYKGRMGLDYLMNEKVAEVCEGCPAYTREFCQGRPE